jgi:hypothetical protein
MVGWESLRTDVRQLLEELAIALAEMPDPDSERDERRIRIELAACATDMAATLSAKYGDLVAQFLLVTRPTTVTDDTPDGQPAASLYRADEAIREAESATCPSELPQ